MLQRASTSIHADDLRVALGREPRPPAPPTCRRRRPRPPALPPAIRALGVDPSGRAVALRLEGPGGGTSTVPPGGEGPVAATVTAQAVEFFYLMGNRRDPGTVATATT